MSVDWQKARAAVQAAVMLERRPPCIRVNLRSYVPTWQVFLQDQRRARRRQMYALKAPPMDLPDVCFKSLTNGSQLNYHKLNGVKALVDE